MTKKAKETSESFEKGMASLEKTLKTLEEGQVSLQESMDLFEAGLRQVHSCQQALFQAQSRMQVILDEYGHILEQPQEEGMNPSHDRRTSS